MSIFSMGAGGAAAAFEIDQSLYIGDSPDSSPKIKRTFTSAGSVNPKWTFATWFKKGGPGTGSKNFWYNRPLSAGAGKNMELQVSNDRPNSTVCYGALTWNSQVYVWTTDPDYGSEGGQMSLTDHGGWSHLCHVVDYSTSPYVYVYINGVLQDPDTIYALTTGDGYATNYSPVSGDTFHVGSNLSNQLAGMYFAHTYWIEQQALTAASFGEFNEDTNQFVPIKYEGTYTGNSFFLDYADSSDLGADQSGLSNDFTVTSISAYQQCEDSPTNNFTILNSNIKQGVDGSGNWIKNGARKAIMAGDSQWGTTIPLPAGTGKWYFEFRRGTGSGSYGIAGDNSDRMWDGDTDPIDAGTHIMYGNSGHKNIDGTVTTYGDSYADGDIMGMALNLDDSEVTFYKNNAVQNSGTAISFSGTITSAKLIIPAGMCASGTMFINGGTDSSFMEEETAQNNSDENGYGDFYYSPPAGYLAICTKNLATPSIEVSTEHYNTVLYTGTDVAAGRAITGVGFQPDFVWSKARSITFNHLVEDAVRGSNKTLRPDETSSEDTDHIAGYLTSFDSDGYTTVAGSTNNSRYNDTDVTYVSWNWKATGGAAVSKTYAVTVAASKLVIGGHSQVTVNMREGSTYTFDTSDSSVSGHTFKFATAADAAGSTEYTTGVTETGTPGSAGAKTVIVVAGSAPQLYYYCSNHSSMGGSANTNITAGSSNFDGTIASTVSTNTTAGFSIVGYIGNGTGDATFGHGLSTSPDAIWIKNRDAAKGWQCWYPDLGSSGGDCTYLLSLDGSGGVGNWCEDTIRLNGTTKVQIASSSGGSTFAWNNETGVDYISYCWNSTEGFSKIGDYEGNGNVNGTFIYTDFTPAFFMVKNTAASGQWRMYDTKRPIINMEDKVLYADASSAESTTGHPVCLYSNGIKIRGTYSDLNTDNVKYIYMAFAEFPFKYSNAR